MASPRTLSAALASPLSIERALSRFGWLGDPDDLLHKLEISRTQLRAVEHDDEVSAALETRRDACVSTPWRLEHADEAAATLLTELLTPVILDLLRGFWDAVPYGYSVTEVVYARDGGRIVPAQVIRCPFEWFLVQPTGATLFRDDLREIDPRKFFVTVREGTLRKPMGEALLAKAYWAWFFRTNGWKFWARFMEQAAVPLLIGRTQGEKETLVNLLRTVSFGPVMAVGDTDAVEALDLPGDSGNKFDVFDTACVRRIQRLILGQTLTSGTDGGSGNRALGEVHDRVREEKRRADILLVSASVQRVVNVLSALNGIEVPPAFVMQDDHGLEEARAKRDATLVTAGIVRFTETYLAEKYGLEPDDFEVPPPSAPVAKPPQPDPAPTLSARFADGDKPARPEFTPEQQAIEDEVARTLPGLPSPVAPAAIASAIRGARDAADLAARLAVALADADDRAFRRALERAMVGAEMTGYLQTAQATGLGLSDTPEA